MTAKNITITTTKVGRQASDVSKLDIKRRVTRSEIIYIKLPSVIFCITHHHCFRFQGYVIIVSLGPADIYILFVHCLKKANRLNGASSFWEGEGNYFLFIHFCTPGISIIFTIYKQLHFCDFLYIATSCTVCPAFVFVYEGKKTKKTDLQYFLVASHEYSNDLNIVRYMI